MTYKFGKVEQDDTNAAVAEDGIAVDKEAGKSWEDFGGVVYSTYNLYQVTVSVIQEAIVRPLTAPSKQKLHENFASSPLKGHNHDPGVDKWTARYGDKWRLPPDDLGLITSKANHNMPIAQMKEKLMAVRKH
ncbi:UNVERIFIED_CONTAM: hypothetical protein HDU68_005942 [Siphonaria sp. JEL0065]|nr:hypothetical protein HDU68_005942 [Siphonaria sp. JEL0065]